MRDGHAGVIQMHAPLPWQQAYEMEICEVQLGNVTYKIGSCDSLAVQYYNTMLQNCTIAHLSIILL